VTRVVERQIPYSTMVAGRRLATIVYSNVATSSAIAYGLPAGRVEARLRATKSSISRVSSGEPSKAYPRLISQSPYLDMGRSVGLTKSALFTLVARFARYRYQQTLQQAGSPRCGLVRRASPFTPALPLFAGGCASHWTFHHKVADRQVIEGTVQKGANRILR